MKTVIHRSTRAASRNSPNILAAIGVSGVLSTAYLAARAAYESRPWLDVQQAEADEEGVEVTLRDKVETAWRFYIPAGVSGAVTIGCIIASTRSHSRRTAAMAAAYSLSEKAFAEYRERIVEEIGERKEESIRDELAQKQVSDNPPSGTVIIDNGQVLCCELHTKRYFRSDVQAIKAAQNEINAKINNHMYVTLDELYDILGLEHTADSDRLGWDSDRLLEIKTRAILAPDGQPCVAFEYNYLKPL